MWCSEDLWGVEGSGEVCYDVERDVAFEGACEPRSDVEVVREADPLRGAGHSAVESWFDYDVLRSDGFE